MRVFNLFLLLSITCALAISCGGGGGGGSSSSSSSSGTMRTAFKAGDLYKAQSGDRIVITELGNTVSSEATVLDEVIATASDTITVDLNPDNDYVIAIYAFNTMPAWRTLVLSEQLQAALNNQGEVDLGEINAVTTFATGVLEVEFNQSRSKVSKQRVKTETQNLLSSWFGTNVQTMADLAYDNELPETTDQFFAWKNRMQVLMVYLEIVGSFSSSPTDSEIEAMQELYTAIFDSESNTNLVSKLSSAALPEYPVDGQTILDNLEADSLLFQDDGLLTKDQLYGVFFEPSQNAGLLLTVAQPPNAQINGSVTGFQAGGISVTAEHDQYSELNTSTVTDEDGSFSFKTLVSGNWTLKPSQDDLVFLPASVQVVLQKSESQEGFDFNSFQFGSNVVPESFQILSGVSYVDASGNEQTGSLTLPDPSNVLSSVSYSDGLGGTQTGSLASESLSDSTTQFASGIYTQGNLQSIDSDLIAENIKSGVEIFGVEGTATSGKSIPAHQKSENTSGTIIIRH